MKHLLVITQKVDQEDDLLGFFVDWLRELAKYFDKISVITLARGEFHLPKNVEVYSLGKERGVSRIRKFFRLCHLLIRFIPSCDGVFAHMSPIFAISAWPLTLIFRKKLVLWYLHKSVTLKLRLALLLSDKVLTADTDSLKVKHKKIVAIGHGINIEKFYSHNRIWGDLGSLHIISVGRISPIKDLSTLITASASAQRTGVALNTHIIGKTVMSNDDAYLIKLKNIIAKENVQDLVSFLGYVPHDQISSVYAESDIVVGLTSPGGIDKTMLEAMASGCIILTSNTVMKKYLGMYSERLMFEHGNSDELAERFKWVFGLSSKDRENIGRTLRESVSLHHNLKTLARRISDTFLI